MQKSEVGEAFLRYCGDTLETGRGFVRDEEYGMLLQTPC